MSGTAPDFSPLAATYARARPRYPDSLFAWLAGEAPGRELAWDCATGSGQAAVALAAHFARVVATDRALAQLEHARLHPRVDYRVARAESSGLEAGTVDLVTVAAALHWFDLERFGAEVRRVLRPGGLLAVWSYHAGTMAPPLGAVFHRFYWQRMKPYFAAGAELVDDGYRSVDLPGEALATPEFEIAVPWTLAQALDYVESWSSLASYRRQTGEDPLPELAAELAPLWRDPRRSLDVRMPLALRVQRL